MDSLLDSFTGNYMILLEKASYTYLHDTDLGKPKETQITDEVSADSFFLKEESG